jgi:hypothetical protein
MHIFGAEAWAALASFCVLSTQEEPPLQSRSDEVLLDVVVRDKKGAALTSLSQDDFTVLDDGVPKSIRGFRLVRGNESVDGSGKECSLTRDVRRGWLLSCLAAWTPAEECYRFRPRSIF